MRLETAPLIFGALFALLGLALLYDAWAPDYSLVKRERRRSARAQRHRGGEAMVGLGALGVAAALAGRDQWAWGNVSVIAGTVLLVFGALLNGALLKELLFNRGASRRRDVSEHGTAAPGSPREGPAEGTAADEPGRRPRIR